MTKVVSDNQRLANRRNAQKSTGPHTPAGKAASSQNALKHGLLARDIVLDTPYGHERRKDFDALLADLIAELRPRNIIQQTLVERIATAYWRLRRAQRLEAAAIRTALEASDPDAAALQRTRRAADRTAASLVLETRLAELLDIPPDRRDPEQTAELQASLDNFARVYAPIIHGLQGQALEEKARDMLPRIIEDFDGKLAALRAKVENAEQQRDARQRMSATLPAGEAFHRIVRYETMLDRQIHRAIAQLRRLQQVTRRGTAQKGNFPNEAI